MLEFIAGLATGTVAFAPLSWREHWTGEHDREQNKSECLRLALARLTPQPPPAQPPR